MRKIIVIMLAIFAFQACKKVPVTGRSQLNLVPDKTINQMAEAQYDQVLDQSKMEVRTEGSAMVDRVGERIANSVDRFAKANGFYEDIASYDWEFNLIDQNVANAWCMPGGKVAFYTGILPFTQDETGMAVVMGHEVAHAIARHGSERMSQGLVTQLGGVALSVAMSSQPYQTQQLFNQAFGIGAQVGMLSFSRKHETEADRMGLIFMAMAGYDPREAVEFWKRMAESGGQQPPEFLSTHPAHDTRIANLESFLPEAMKYYKPASTGIEN